MLKAEMQRELDEAKAELGRVSKKSDARWDRIAELKELVEKLTWFRDQYHTMWGKYQGFRDGVLVERNPIPEGATVKNLDHHTNDVTEKSESMVLLEGLIHSPTEAPEPPSKKESGNTGVSWRTFG